MSILNNLQGLALGAIGIIGALGAIIFGARRAGRNKERAKHIEQELEESEANHVIKDRQLDAAADRPRNRGDLGDRMRNGKF